MKKYYLLKTTGFNMHFKKAEEYIIQNIVINTY